MTGLDRAAEALADAVDDAIGEVASELEQGMWDSARIDCSDTRPFVALDDPWIVGLALGAAALRDARGEPRCDPTLAEFLSGLTGYRPPSIGYAPKDPTP